ncbi:MaoC family dehydratase N-terminal domain-containing protein [Mesorhizobium sp. M0500]|uniref:FAS1-like dehydratase domain-containing protein n=1 Tax=Mesorhizobium sp. M0500 TaxID=2956953 RepID=UPI003339BE2E
MATHPIQTLWESKGNHLTWEEVEVGAQLQQLRFPITWKTMAIAAAGTRDFFPYHHHPTQPKELGMRGPFVNTMFFQGLFSRFTTDWSGPESFVISLDLQMVDQLIPGDTAIVSGTVTGKSTDPERVELKLKIENQIGVVALSTVWLAMPSRRGDAISPSLEDEALPDPDPAMPAEAKEWYGRELVRQAVYPVSEAQIGLWADAVQDANPLYAPTEYAARSRFGGMIAPPVSLLTWIQPRAHQQGPDIRHPDVDNPDQPPWPNMASGSATAQFRMPGVSEIIVPKITLECGSPYRPGDTVSMTSSLAACSPRKRTRLGDGYFVTFKEIYKNQLGDITGRIFMTLFQYGTK